MAVGPNSSRLLETLKKLWATNNMNFYQAEQLPSLVREAGFDDVQTYDKKWRLDEEANKLQRGEHYQRSYGSQRPRNKARPVKLKS